MQKVKQKRENWKKQLPYMLIIIVASFLLLVQTQEVMAKNSVIESNYQIKADYYDKKEVTFNNKKDDIAKNYYLDLKKTTKVKIALTVDCKCDFVVAAFDEKKDEYASIIAETTINKLNNKYNVQLKLKPGKYQVHMYLYNKALTTATYSMKITGLTKLPKGIRHERYEVQLGQSIPVSYLGQYGKMENSDKKIANINKNGKLVAKKKGTCVIKQSYFDRELTQTVVVTGYDMYTVTAKQIVNYFAKNELETDFAKYYTSQNDPNQLLGTSEGYTSKATFQDVLNMNYKKETITVEVFSEDYLVEQRLKFLKSLYRQYPDMAEKVYSVDGVVIRFPKQYDTKRIKRYLKVLQYMRRD